MCEYCHSRLHPSSCPNAEQDYKHECEECQEPIYDGQEYAVDNGFDYYHVSCLHSYVSGMTDTELADALGFMIRR